MPRRSSRAVARYSDGQFTVVAEKRSNHHSFRVRAWFKGQDQKTEAASTAEEARQAAESIWLAYVDGIFDNPARTPETLEALTKQFSSRADLRPATQRTYQELLGRFASWLGEARAPASVRRRDVQRWLDDQSCSNTSKVSYLRTLRACFRWAKKQGFVEDVPTDGVELPKVHQQMRSWLPHDEWERFLAACPPSLRVRAQFALHTGLRKGEVRNARWEWIAATAGRPVIRVAPDPTTDFVPKWGQARAVPLSRGAQEALKAAKARWGSSGFIFAADRLGDSNFAHRTRQACRKAKVTDVDFHGLRRSAGARWLELGFAMHEVSRLLGHQSITTTERWYAGVGERHLVKLFDRVEAGT